MFSRQCERVVYMMNQVNYGICMNRTIILNGGVLSKAGSAILIFSILVLLLNVIILKSDSLFGISIKGILLGVLLLFVSGFLGNCFGGAGSGDGEGNGNGSTNKNESTRAVVETTESSIVPTIQPSAEPEKKEIIIEVKNNNIYVDDKECNDSKTIIEEIDNVYSDEYTIWVVDNNAEHKSYVLVENTLRENGYSYYER